MAEVATVPPALYLHCVTVYEAMMDRAEVREVQGNEGSLHIKVYVGAGTRLFRELGLNTPQYSIVMSALKDMDCIRQLRRGGGGAPSEWLLLQHPTRELFDSLNSKTPQGQKADGQAQMLNDLNRRVSRLERALFDREGEPV